MSPLSTHERDTLSDADRAMLDDAVRQIPSEDGALFTALLLSTRAVVRHDTAGIRTEVAGWPQLLDAADERQRELVDAARGLQTAAEALRAELAALQVGAAESRADRADLRRQVRSGQRWTWALGGAVAVLLAELIWRYGAVLLGALLSLIVVVWSGTL